MCVEYRVVVEKLTMKLFPVFVLAVTAGVSADVSLRATEWWMNGVFYQIYPRSFKDSDGNGVGDLKGVIEKLPYLKELGISAAWLSPIFKSPMIDHGYDIEDFYTIDPLFGTNADAEELFKKAKELGIKIILDFVPNHTSDRSVWFRKSIEMDPIYKDYYIWHDGKELPSGKRVPPNNWVRNNRQTSNLINAFKNILILFSSHHPLTAIGFLRIRMDME